MVGHRDRLPRAVGIAPILLEFMCLDNAPRNVVCFLGCPVERQKLDAMILVHPFQLEISHDST